MASNSRVVMPGSSASPMAFRVRATTRPATFSFSSSSSLPMVMGVSSQIRSDDGLADHLAVGEGIEGCAPLVERIFRVDAGLHQAGFGEGPDGFVVLAALCRELAAVLACADSHHREALDQGT